MHFQRLTGTATAIVLTAAVALFGGAATASAAEAGTDAQATAQRVYEELQASQNPEATFEGFSESEQKAFTDYFLPAQEVESVTITPVSSDGAATGPSSEYASSASAMAEMQKSASAQQCWQTSKRMTTVNNVGIGLFDIWVEGTWCGAVNGGTSSASFDRSWSTIGTVGWRDAGQMYKGALANNGVGTILGQRKMILGVGGWDVREDHPCARLYTIGNSSSVDGNCYLQ